MRWVYIKKGGSVRDLCDGETVLYLDCDGGYTNYTFYRISQNCTTNNNNKKTVYVRTVKSEKTLQFIIVSIVPASICWF